MLDEVPVVLASAFGLQPHSFSCIPCNINILSGHTNQMNKTGFRLFFFSPESITAVLLHVKKQGNKYSLKKQVTIAVN